MVRFKSTPVNIRVGDDLYPADEVVQALTPFVTADRLAKIDNVIASRSRHLIPVVEGIYDLGNISAVMRSAEAFGFSEFHIIEGDSGVYKRSNRVSQGAEKWLKVVRHANPEVAVKSLKQQGYRILVTDLGSDSIPIEKVSFDAATALIFGNEKDGISPALRKLADGNVNLPMVGFTQSFNISVAASLCFFHIFKALEKHQGQLAPIEIEELKSQYLVNSIRHAESILRRVVSGAELRP